MIQCNWPLCVAIHDNGDIYVGSYDHCIYVFDQIGQLKNTIGCSGSGDGQFSYPYGVSIKGDVLYVADSGNCREQKLTSSGKFLHKFGQQGSGQGQFNFPVAVIIDSNNKLIVSDYCNHRIQIFNENGGPHSPHQSCLPHTLPHQSCLPHTPLTSHVSPTLSLTSHVSPTLSLTSHVSPHSPSPVMSPPHSPSRTSHILPLMITDTIICSFTEQSTSSQ